MDQINHSPPPISENTKFIIKTYITRQRRPSIGLISRKKILPGPLVTRLGQTKGHDGLHLIFLIFSSCKLYRMEVFTHITQGLPERLDTCITFSPMASIPLQIAFLTFGLY